MLFIIKTIQNNFRLILLTQFNTCFQHVQKVFTSACNAWLRVNKQSSRLRGNIIIKYYEKSYIFINKPSFWTLNTLHFPAIYNKFMQRSLEIKIDYFRSSFKVEEGTLHICLKNPQKMVLLMAQYTYDTIPDRIKNLVNSMDELYEVLTENPENLNVQNNDLLFYIQVGKNKKQYRLCLEQKELSKEEKLQCENEMLKEALKGVSLEQLKLKQVKVNELTKKIEIMTKQISELFENNCTLSNKLQHQQEKIKQVQAKVNSVDEAKMVPDSSAFGQSLFSQGTSAFRSNQNQRSGLLGGFK